MAFTDAQIAKKIVDLVNSARGTVNSRVQFARYTSGTSFTVRMRNGQETTVTVETPPEDP